MAVGPSPSAGGVASAAAVAPPRLGASLEAEPGVSDPWKVGKG